MSLNDAYNVHETIDIITFIGVKKMKERIDYLIIKSFLAGILLSFGGLFLVIVGGGSVRLSEIVGSGIQKMIQAGVFPVGIILVFLSSTDLFTGNTMILTISTLNRKTTWLNLIYCWIITFFGNLIGCLFFQYIFVYHVNLLSDEPYRSFIIKIAEIKGNSKWHELFLKGIAGNWLACLAFWMGLSARDLNSKIISVYLPVWLFVTVGYEHSIANMFTVQMGMILGAKLSIEKYILRVLIPVTLGNILGGGFFVGFIHWYLFSTRKDDNNIGSLDNRSYQVVKQYKEIVQSQQP